MRTILIFLIGSISLVHSQIPTNFSSVSKKKIVLKLNEETTVELPEETRFYVKELRRSNGYNVAKIEITEGSKIRTIQNFKDGGSVGGERTTSGNEKYEIKYEDLKDAEYIPTSGNLMSFWESYLTKSKVYDRLLTRGFQNDLRADLEGDALNYLNYISNRLFQDDYINDYVYRLVSKFYPFQTDGRRGNVNVQIEINPSPNASILPNGSMIITTGLFSTLNSEKELMAVLAHEVAHYMLDHQVENLNAIARKEKKAAFWAGMATAAAAATEIYFAKEGVYTGGNLTLLTANLAYATAQEVVENFGFRHSREQELEADLCATELLKFIGEDPRHLSSALQKLQSYGIRYGIDDRVYKESTHPSLAERIKNIGNPVGVENTGGFNYAISRLNTFNANLEFGAKHFALSEELSQRNIAAKVASQDDYLVKARVLLATFDDAQHNQESLGWVEKAKAVPPAIRDDVFKLEGLIHLRLGKKDLALIAFKEYSKRIEKHLASPLTPIKGSQYILFWENEHSWANDMMLKCV